MPNSVGRPRDEHIDAGILAAAAGILAEKGYTGLKMDAVAAQAGVSKHTLYLRYKSPVELTIGLLRQLAGSAMKIPDSGALKDDLTLLTQGLRRLLLETPYGAIIPALLAAGPAYPELIQTARSLLNARIDLMEPVVLRAIQRKELPEQTNCREFLEFCFAPLYYRYLISGATLDDQFIDRLVQRGLAWK